MAFGNISGIGAAGSRGKNVGASDMNATVGNRFGHRLIGVCQLNWRKCKC